MQSEAAWSLLSPDPVIIYLKDFDEHIVYWHGIGMLHATACTLACHHLAHIYPTLAVKQSLYNKFLTLYNAGIFETSDWDEPANRGPENHYRLLEYWLFDNKKETRNVKEVLSLLNISRSITK